MEPSRTRLGEIPSALVVLVVTRLVAHIIIAGVAVLHAKIEGPPLG